MRSMARFWLMVGLFAVAGFSTSAVRSADQKGTEQKQTQTPEAWRYTFHNGEWWYWLPADRWVYWRDSQWNDYNPKRFVSPSPATVVATGRMSADNGGQAGLNLDTRPFYGHSLSSPDQRSLEVNGETGPFYGHTLPNEALGPWRAHRNANRPFYGHAVSSEGD
jgi:hypothetical protein